MEDRRPSPSTPGSSIPQPSGRRGLTHAKSSGEPSGRRLHEVSYSNLAMSSLLEVAKLEGWFKVASMGARMLDRAEYRELVASWQSVFEPLLKAGDRLTGAKAEAGLRAHLPADMFVFSMPGYRYLPASTNSREPRYAFRVSQLSNVDFGVANSEDAILVDTELTFTCLCTHEAGAFAEPILAPRSAGRIVQLP